MNTLEISLLSNTTDKICISVIQPFYHTWTDNKENKVLVHKALNKIRKKLDLDENISKDKADALFEKLKDLSSKIDYDHLTLGIGLYVSDNNAEMVDFHFAVNEVVEIGPRFCIRPLVFDAAKSVPYVVLMLSRTHIHVYKGSLKHLEEVHEGGFPMTYKDTYEYDTPSQRSGNSSSLKGGEEKSVTKEHHLFTFYRAADHALTTVINPDMPIVITGPEECISIYKEAAKNYWQVISEIPGNYEHSNILFLEEVIFSEINKWQNIKAVHLISDVAEMLGTGMATYGLENAWQAGVAGNANVLVVDADYYPQGYTDEYGSSVSASPSPQVSNYSPDAVNDLMTIVINKGGEICFAPKGSLDNFGQIAVMQRYANIQA